MKSTISIIVIIIFAFLLITCKKYDAAKSDADGTLYLRGRVFYYDDVTTTGTAKQLGKTVVKIGYPTNNSLNYLYSTTADDDGYFVFKNLSSNKDYLIYADTVISGIRFSVKDTIRLAAPLDSARVILLADQDTQNGFVYTVRDNLGGIVKDCQVCVFSSFILASRDTCAGSTWQLGTNENGKANKMNIPQGTYITYFSGGSDTLLLKGRDTITVTAKGIVRKDVVVRKR